MGMANLQSFNLKICFVSLRAASTTAFALLMPLTESTCASLPGGVGGGVGCRRLGSGS